MPKIKEEDRIEITPKIKKINEEAPSIAGSRYNSVKNSDEIHQYFGPSRYCTIRDMYVNAIGGIEGVLFDGGNLSSPSRRRFAK